MLLALSIDPRMLWEPVSLRCNGAMNARAKRGAAILELRDILIGKPSGSPLTRCDDTAYEFGSGFDFAAIPHE
jgi:hypothetical protein